MLHRQPAHRRLYYTEPAAGLNGRKLRYPRGKVLGGCSSINGMVCMRGQARDHDGWAPATVDARWRWSNCLPCFKRHEDHWRGADAAHAAPGFDPKGERPTSRGTVRSTSPRPRGAGADDRRARRALAVDAAAAARRVSPG